MKKIDTVWLLLRANPAFSKGKPERTLRQPERTLRGSDGKHLNWFTKLQEILSVIYVKGNELDCLKASNVDETWHKPEFCRCVALNLRFTLSSRVHYL